MQKRQLIVHRKELDAKKKTWATQKIGCLKTEYATVEQAGVDSLDKKLKEREIAHQARL